MVKRGERKERGRGEREREREREREERERRERERERERDGYGRFIHLGHCPHEGVRVDDLPPHSTYYNCAYEQENQQTHDSLWLEREREMGGGGGGERERGGK